MDIGRVLTRSIDIAWRYRALWLLGFVYALFGGSGGTFSPAGNLSYRTNRIEDVFPTAPELRGGAAAAIVAAVVCLGLIFLILTLYFKFVARGAMVAAVRRIENGGTPTFGGAWAEGHRYWGRLLGLGLLVGIPLALVSIVVIGVSVLPVILAAINEANAGGTASDIGSRIGPALASTIALFCCALCCVVVLQVIIHPIYQFAVRAIVLEEKGTTDGLGQGWARVRDNLGSVILLYLMMIGARIVWGIALFIVGIPVILILAAIIAGAARQSTATAIVVGIVLGIPVGLLFVLLEGIFQAFEQTAWTEGYMGVSGLAPVPVAPAAPPPAAPVTAGEG